VHTATCIACFELSKHCSFPSQNCGGGEGGGGGGAPTWQTSSLRDMEVPWNHNCSMYQLWFQDSFITASSNHRRRGGEQGGGRSCGYMYIQIHALNTTTSMLYLLDKESLKSQMRSSMGLYDHQMTQCNPQLSSCSR